MSKKQKKSTLSATEAANSRASHEITNQSILMDSLSAIDKLNQDSKYVHALDRICLDLQHCDAKEKTIAQYEQRYLTAIAGLCGGKDISIEPGRLRNLLSTAHFSIVQLACATWIRASLACATFPASQDIEREIADAVDKSFSDVYRKLALDSKAQTYEKRKNLLNALDTLEGDMHCLLNSPVSVSLIGALRQGFMRLFKTPIAQAVVWPFLPDEMRSEPRLAQLFQCVSELAEASSDDLMEAFENASEILETFTAEAEQLATHYSQEILATLVKLLTQALADYMLSSPLAQPARIEILEVKKKYPLSSVGTNLRLAFLLKNYGPGTAQDVLFKIVEIGAITLHAEKTEWYLGTVSETAVDISVPITVNQPTNETAIRTLVTWKNFDHSEGVGEFVFDLYQQRTDVDWEIKKYLDPYSLEPVEDESELVGRTDVLEELSSLAYAKSVGSCYLFGQKRVGKTSVVKTFRNKLKNNHDSNCPSVIYLERGEFAGTDPISTIKNLGEKLCQKLKDCDRRFDHLVLPIFNDTLISLNTFLDDIGRIAPQFRALFILDEFDELPIGLYIRTEIGDAFFG